MELCATLQNVNTDYLGIYVKKISGNVSFRSELATQYVKSLLAKTETSASIGHNTNHCLIPLQTVQWPSKLNTLQILHVFWGQSCLCYEGKNARL